MAQHLLGVTAQVQIRQSGALGPGDAVNRRALGQAATGVRQSGVASLKRFSIFQKKKVAVAALQITHQRDLVGVGVVGVFVQGVPHQVLVEYRCRLAVPVGVPAQGGKGVLDRPDGLLRQGGRAHIGDLVVGLHLAGAVKG